MYYVYILKNNEGIIYVGQTNNLNKRLKRHNSNQGALFTKNKQKFALVYQEAHSTQLSAMRRELQIKKWSRGKKEALIAGDKVALKVLARKK